MAGPEETIASDMLMTAVAWRYYFRARLHISVITATFVVPLRHSVKQVSMTHTKIYNAKNFVVPDFTLHGQVVQAFSLDNVS